jgi:hypothetical protein
MSTTLTATPEDDLAVGAALALLRVQARHTLIPTFVGLTGVGKSARAEQIAERLGLPLVETRWQSDMPEELTGYPVPDRRAGVMRKLPQEEIRRASRQPVLLLLEELDKPREEVRAGLLSLLWDRTLGRVTLHPGTRVLACMQPVESDWLASQTGQALSARCCFLPVTAAPAWTRLGREWGIDLSWLPGPEPPIPVPEASPRCAEAVIASVVRAGLAPDDPRAIMIARGCLPAPIADKILAALGGDWRAARLRQLVHDEAELELLLQSDSAPLLTDLLLAVVIELPPPVTHRVMARLWELDPSGDFPTRAITRAGERAPASPRWGATTAAEIEAASDAVLAELK